MFTFLLVAALGAGILFGLLPAFTASRLDVQKGLAATRSVGYGSSGWSGRRLRNGLVIAEIAMAFVLVVGAGVYCRHFCIFKTRLSVLCADNVLTLNMSASINGQSNTSPIRALSRTNWKNAFVRFQG